MSRKGAGGVLGARSVREGGKAAFEHPAEGGKLEVMGLSWGRGISRGSWRASSGAGEVSAVL